MAETIVQETTQETTQQSVEAPKVTGKIASMGRVEKAEMPVQAAQLRSAFPSGETPAPAVTTEAEVQTSTENSPAASDAQQTSPAEAQVPELTPEQKKAFLAKFNIDYDGNDDVLKEKFAKINGDASTQTQETDEDKQKRESAFEKRMLDLYVENGGTAEDFVALKQIAAVDLKELSVSEIRREMKENNFSDAEIELILKERYYQLEDDDIEQYEDESDKDFLKRKKEYGAKKLASRSKYLQDDAVSRLAQLRDAVTAKDTLVKAEKDFSSKVDEHFSALPKKMTFQLGESNDEQIDPIVFEVSEADISEVAETLKNPDRRQQFFFNDDNSLNLKNVGDVILKNIVLAKAIKKAYLEGSTREVAKLRNVFPDNPAALGVGGGARQNNGVKGKITGFGKPQVVQNQ